MIGVAVYLTQAASEVPRDRQEPEDPRSEMIRARNEMIVDRLIVGRTEESVAAEWGLSRQRVSQIFHRMTGKLLKDVRVPAEPDPPPVRFFCRRCGVAVTRENGRRKQTYCTICSGLVHGHSVRRVAVLLTCQHCGQKFHPWFRPARFCSRRCYFDHRFPNRGRAE